MYNFSSCNWTTKIKTNNEIFGSMKNPHWKISFARYMYGENTSCIYYRMTATHKSVQWLKRAGTYANLLIIDRSKRHEKFSWRITKFIMMYFGVHVSFNWISLIKQGEGDERGKKLQSNMFDLFIFFLMVIRYNKE